MLNAECQALNAKCRVLHWNSAEANGVRWPFRSSKPARL